MMMKIRMQDRSYYMVRAKGQTDDEFDCFFDNDVVAIGWSKVDIRGLDSKSEVDDVMSEHYGFWSEAYASVRGKRENEILRFNGIAEGDRVLVPYRSSVALATARSEHRYVPGTGVDLANQIAVAYVRDEEGDLLTVSRSELTEALQRRLRVQGSTVTDLGEFADEIERLYSADGQFTWQAHHRAEEEKRRDRFQRELLSRLRAGNVHVRGGGLGLEKLVAELLRHEGYDEVSTLGTRGFEGEGDADVQATRADRFGEQKLLVQVKHHRGTSGRRGLSQLAAIRDNEPENWGDHDLVLVTTGTVPDDVQGRADQIGVEVMEGEDLIEWLLDHVDALNPRTRRILGMSEVPALVN
jgi:restriction system protein